MALCVSITYGLPSGVHFSSHPTYLLVSMCVCAVTLELLYTILEVMVPTCFDCLEIRICKRKRGDEKKGAIKHILYGVLIKVLPSFLLLIIPTMIIIYSDPQCTRFNNTHKVYLVRYTLPLPPPALQVYL
jgi:hypothetical protein